MRSQIIFELSNPSGGGGLISKFYYHSFDSLGMGIVDFHSFLVWMQRQSTVGKGAFQLF